MLSVVIPFHNTGEFAPLCLSSVLETFRQLDMLGRTEFVLIDDASDPSHGMTALLEKFRRSVPSRCTLVHLKSRQHNAYASALGCSLAAGEAIMLLSQDMIVPPAFVRTILRGVDEVPSVGIVRGVSPHMDGAPGHVIAPPMPSRNYSDVCLFSEYVASYWDTQIVGEGTVVTDAVVFRRSVIEKAGVMDPRLHHFFGDLDWSLRIERAGFKIGCAKGAWLHHDAAIHTKRVLNMWTSVEEANRQASQLIADSYSLFRQKWDPSLPGEYGNQTDFNFERMRALPARGEDYFAPLKVDAEICIVL